MSQFFNFINNLFLNLTKFFFIIDFFIIKVIVTNFIINIKNVNIFFKY